MVMFIVFSCLSIGAVFGFMLCALLSMNGDDDDNG